MRMSTYGWNAPEDREWDVVDLTYDRPITRGGRKRQLDSNRSVRRPEASTVSPSILPTDDLADPDLLRILGRRDAELTRTESLLRPREDDANATRSEFDYTARRDLGDGDAKSGRQRSVAVVPRVRECPNNDHQDGRSGSEP